MKPKYNLDEEYWRFDFLFYMIIVLSLVLVSFVVIVEEQNRTITEIKNQLNNTQTNCLPEQPPTQQPCTYTITFNGREACK